MRTCHGQKPYYRLFSLNLTEAYAAFNLQPQFASLLFLSVSGPFPCSSSFILSGIKRYKLTAESSRERESALYSPKRSRSRGAYVKNHAKCLRGLKWNVAVTEVKSRRALLCHASILRRVLTPTAISLGLLLRPGHADISLLQLSMLTSYKYARLIWYMFNFA